MKKKLRYDSMPSMSGNRRICNDCIGEPFLSNFVEKNGKKKKCAYCCNTGRTIAVEELADRTQNVLKKFYQRTAENPDNYQYALMADKESDYWWQRDGDAITDVIEDVAGIAKEAAEDVQTILQERFYDRSAEEIGEETEFDDESYYEYIGVKSKAWEEKWIDFANSLKKDTRYFNQLGKEYLDAVFKDLNKLKTAEKNPVIFAGPDHKLKTVFRARVFLSDESLRLGLSNLVEQLGPPLPQFAKAGRMNATGISVFYGATDEKTALAEVRPPVGSKVAVAKFRFIRNLKLLNLMELQKIRIDGSLFDEAHAGLLSRVQFLNQLCDKMTIPVMPGEEEMEYLVTQAIADYLSMDPSLDLDGIVFPSIQTKERSNIVLFHKASRVKPRELPVGTKVSVSLWDYEDDEPYPSFTLLEETPIEKVKEFTPPFDNDPRPVTLGIDDQEIKIHFIQGVEYRSDPHDLTVDRHEQVDYDKIEERLGFRKAIDW